MLEKGSPLSNLAGLNIAKPCYISCWQTCHQRRHWTFSKSQPSMPPVTLKTQSIPGGNFVVIGGPGGCYFDNRQVSVHDIRNLLFQILMLWWTHFMKILFHGAFGSHYKIIWQESAAKGQISNLQNIHNFSSMGKPGDAYMCQWDGPSLVQVMACHLYGAKPLPEPMLIHCQLDLKEQICIWKMMFAKWGLFGSSLNVLTAKLHR